MATDDYGQGISIADLGMAPDAEALAKNIANPLASRSVMRFASASVRSAALVDAAAPVEGMLSWLQDVNKLYVYEGAQWVELGRYLPPVFVPDAANLAFTNPGATYASGSRPLAAVITVPPSGKVLATWGVRVDNTVGANTLSCPLATGVSSGTVFTPDDTVATQWNDTTSAGPMTGMVQITATPGDTLTATLQHRIAGGGGTSNLRARYLRLDPV